MIIDNCLLDEVSKLARNSPRLRKNYNFHADDKAPCHRLLNAIEPLSYVCVHRHLDPSKEESLLILRGSLGVVFFDPDGVVCAKCLLSAYSDAIGVNIPVGQFHSVLALASNTVFFETKAGPYLPLQPNEIASFAPLEYTSEAAEYYQQLTALFA